jgi:hypothetical protein
MYILVNKYGVLPSEIKKYCVGSQMDRDESVDISVRGKNYQIKPLTYITEKNNGSFEVKTYQMRDWYKYKPLLDYILYSDGYKIYIFENKNYSVSDYLSVVTHYNSPISTLFDDKDSNHSEIFR